MKNNNKEIITLLAKQSYKSNQNRNRILITAIAFVVVMLFGVFSLSIGKIETDYLLYTRNSGTAAYTTLERAADWQQEEIQALDYIKAVGSRVNIGYTDAFSCQVLDKTAYEKMQVPAYTDIHGTYPAEEDQVMLPMRALEQMDISAPEIGMEIPLKITFSNGEVRENSFFLSGYYTEYVDPMSAPPFGYFSQEFLDTLDIDIQENTTLLIQQKDSLTDEFIENKLYQDVTMVDDSQQFFGGNSMTYQAIFDLTGGFDTGILLTLVILTGAYLLLYNVLHISMSRDIRQYGLLKTLGTTQKQLRQIVYKQVWKMVLYGGLTGSFLGCFITVTVVPELLSDMYLHGLGKTSAMIAFKPWILILSLGFSSGVTLLSAAIAMKKAVRMSPIEAAKYSGGMIGKQRPIRTTTSGNGLVQMAWRNMVRLKKRFFLTVCSLLLGIVIALGAVVIARGTDSTNQIAYENEDFEIICNMTSMQASQYEADENYFPEELVQRMAGLDGITKVQRTWGGYGMVKSEEKALDLLLEEHSGTEGYYESVVQVVSAEYLEQLETFARKESLYLDVETVKSGNGVLLLHYNQLSQIQREKSKERIGLPIVFYDMEKKETTEMKFGGYLNFKQKRLPKLETTWNGPGILYFLVSEEGFEKLGIPEQNFKLQLTAEPEKEPLLKETLKQIVKERNNGLLNFQKTEDQDARALMMQAKSDILEAQRSYIMSSRIIMGALCSIMLFMGLANYVNMTMTGLAIRRTEFAVLESIGMTKRQLRNMILLEGVLYSCIISVLTLTAGSIVLWGIGSVMKQRIAYFRFIYPMPELMLCIGELFGICVGIPIFLYKRNPG